MTNNILYFWIFFSSILGIWATGGLGIAILFANVPFAVCVCGIAMAWIFGSLAERVSFNQGAMMVQMHCDKLLADFLSSFHLWWRHCWKEERETISIGVGLMAILVQVAPVIMLLRGILSGATNQVTITWALFWVTSFIVTATFFAAAKKNAGKGAHGRSDAHSRRHRLQRHFWGMSVGNRIHRKRVRLARVDDDRIVGCVASALVSSRRTTDWLRLLPHQHVTPLPTAVEVATHENDK